MEAREGSTSAGADSPPRVTIGVPAYNSARYLPETLESLLSQTYEDIEVLVCDNASTDETPDIVRRFAAEDSRVRYVRNPENIGLGRNFIRCVELARGELFRWASADDLSAPTFVERCVEVLDRDSEVVQAYPRSVLIDENGRELERYEDEIETMADSPRDRYLHVMDSLGLVNAFYGVMRTDVLRQTSIHGAYVGADVVVQAEIALYGKIQEVPEYLFFRRMHAEAHSAMSNAEQQRLYEPGRSRDDPFFAWNHLLARYRSVLRSPLSLAQKARLALDLARRGVWIRESLSRELWRACRRTLAAVGSGDSAKDT